MDDGDNLRPPSVWNAISVETQALDFDMASEPATGSLLRTLAASKPHGMLLELGTGTGLATAWILDGMDSESSLLSVDRDERLVTVAKRHLGHDARVEFQIRDAAEFLEAAGQRRYDFIFADTWAGKYTHLDHALGLLTPGGLFIIDDMLPQDSWPEGHQQKVHRLINELERKKELVLTKMDWATGLISATRGSLP